MKEKEEENFSIINQTKGKLPGLSFVNILKEIKKEILGEDYSLSIVYVSEKKSREINRNYRQKDNPTNILSFPLSKKSGEILLCPNVIKREAPNFDKNFEGWLGFLVIHGTLHLKGMQHSDRMEEAEKKYDKKYFDRNRYGISNDKNSRRRISSGRKKS